MARRVFPPTSSKLCGALPDKPSGGLRSRGFLSQGGTPDGEPPRKARGKKQHTSVVSEKPESGPAPKVKDISIRAKRLPSLREERDAEKNK